VEAGGEGRGQRRRREDEGEGRRRRRRRRKGPLPFCSRGRSGSIRWGRMSGWSQTTDQTQIMSMEICNNNNNNNTGGARHDL